MSNVDHNFPIEQHLFIQSSWEKLFHPFFLSQVNFVKSIEVHQKFWFSKILGKDLSDMIGLNGTTHIAVLKLK